VAKNEGRNDILSDARAELATVADLKAENLKAVLLAVREKHELKLGEPQAPIRVAETGPDDQTPAVRVLGAARPRPRAGWSGRRDQEAGRTGVAAAEQEGLGRAAAQPSHVQREHAEVTGAQCRSGSKLKSSRTEARKPGAGLRADREGVTRGRVDRQGSRGQPGWGRSWHGLDLGKSQAQAPSTLRAVARRRTGLRRRRPGRHCYCAYPHGASICLLTLPGQAARSTLARS
jgi:hypothetical protein